MIPKKSVDWPRKIIHIDMDAFFAAVEQRDNPQLQGKPVVVGGDPNSRGVVSTASYEARKFGVHSAMPASQAKRLCPQAIFIRPNFQKYQAASDQVMGVLGQHSALVEPVSVDEAYVDVTEHRLGIKDPVMVASLIKQNIHALTRLTASAGVAPNLFLSKVASDFKKPDGLTVIEPSGVEAFLKDLPVRKIPGVGPVTEAELHGLKIFTCGELAAAEPAFLVRHFGKTGHFLHARALGLDDRKVEPNVPSKQYSSEETFERDLADLRVMKGKLEVYAQEVFLGLSSEGRMGRTIVLKVKYFDFESITRSRTLARYPKSWQEVHATACELLETKTLAGKKTVRLLGIGISGLEEPSKPQASGQKELFDYA